MLIEKTKLDGVVIITPPIIHEDFRGTNTEVYNEKIYKDAGIQNDFILDSVSTSRKHVLRGLHGDDITTKLISCLYGSIYMIVVNNDSSSPQYKQWTSFTLSDRNRKQVLVPAKFGNGHLVMSNQVVFHYKLDAYYNRDSQFTIGWDDASYNFWWPIKNPILSERDSMV